MPNPPEMSRKVQVNSLGRQDGPKRGLVAQEIVVEAEPGEHAALARRLGVPAVLALRCRFQLSGLDQSGRVSADGLLTATLTRVCVASLEEFDSEVVEAFRIRFVPGDAGDGEAENEEVLDPDSDDDVPYEGVRIDLGEAAVEQLALAMEPYPRKPGVELPASIGSVDLPPDGIETGEEDDDRDARAGARPNPFAVLASRKPS